MTQYVGDAPAAPQEFVVHTDRPAVHRLHITILVVHSVLALVMVGAIVMLGFLDANPLAGLPFLVLLVGQTFQLSLHSYLYGTRIVLSEPLRVSPGGLELTTQNGRMELPWEAVASVRTVRALHRQVVISLHPAAEPDSPGIRTDVSARNWRRLKKHGIHIGARGIREELAEVTGAIGWFSRGRVPVG